MSYCFCLNPNCPQPLNPIDHNFCQSCGAKLLLNNRYRAIKQLGEGGFGITYLGRDEYIPTHPFCVIKRFSPQAKGIKALETAERLFKQEATRLHELDKEDHIPKLLASFEESNNLYLIQEFIDGENLAEEHERLGSFNQSKIRELLASILPILKIVHNKSVIYRDIKPENLMRRRTDNQFFIIDFGAARFVSGSTLFGSTVHTMLNYQSNAKTIKLYF